MTCGEVFLFGLNNPFGSVYFYQLFKKQMAKAPHTTISGIYKTNARQRKILTVFKYTGIVFQISHILVVFLKESRERCSITFRTPCSGFGLLFFIFINLKK